MRIWVIDAFTDRPFAGNPAAVCLLDTNAWPDRVWMLQLAAELHLETAFAHPLPAAADADWALRWFTPTAESNLCGHATLATAHALHSDRGTLGTVRFASRFGVLIAHSRRDGTITLDFPAARPIQAAAPDGLAEALGATPQAFYHTGALGALLVQSPGPRPPHRAAGVYPHRPGPHRRPRRPRAPHRPRRHYSRRRLAPPRWITPGGAGRAYHLEPCRCPISASPPVVPTVHDGYFWLVEPSGSRVPDLSMPSGTSTVHSSLLP